MKDLILEDTKMKNRIVGKIVGYENDKKPRITIEVDRSDVVEIPLNGQIEIEMFVEEE